MLYILLKNIIHNIQILFLSIIIHINYNIIMSQEDKIYFTFIFMIYRLPAVSELSVDGECATNITTTILLTLNSKHNNIFQYY